MKHLALLSATALVLAACSNPTPSSDAPENGAEETGISGNTRNGNGEAMTETSGGDEPAESAADDFAAACLNATNNSPSMCSCLAEKADEDLTGDARDFLVASMNEDNDRVLAMRGQLSVEEMSVAGMFLVTASTECAQEGRQ